MAPMGRRPHAEDDTTTLGADTTMTTPDEDATHNTNLTTEAAAIVTDGPAYNDDSGTTRLTQRPNEPHTTTRDHEMTPRLDDQPHNNEQQDNPIELTRPTQQLNEPQITTPPELPVRLFKEWCAEFCIIIAILARFCLKCRRWPRRWRFHWVHPLFKKGSVSNPSNYRGVHLTTVISKIVERTIARILTPFLDSSNAYGMDQWAFRPKRSCRDL